MRSWHRIIMVFTTIFLLFLGITGSIIQGIDLFAIAAARPADDPTMISIEDGLSGPPNFVVRTIGDYSAPSLPASFDFRPALTTVIRSARVVLSTAPLDFVEFRMVGGKPVGRVQGGGRLLTIDPRQGRVLISGPAEAIAFVPGTAFRDEVKDIHRMSPVFGQAAMWFQLASAIALLAMIATGTLVYLQLLKARRRMKRRGFFWRAGDGWRNLHRAVSVTAAAFLSIVAISGALLAVDNIGGSIYMSRHRLTGASANVRDPLASSAATPLDDTRLPSMLAATLAGARERPGHAPIRVLRLRNYGTMAQGVVVDGSDKTRQIMFDADTGASVGLTEKGYPDTPFPFGWGWHETVKQVHRGSYLGLTSRITDLLAGLALVFLTASGLAMYAQVYRRRFAAGKRSLVWK